MNFKDIKSGTLFRIAFNCNLWYDSFKVSDRASPNLEAKKNDIVIFLSHHSSGSGTNIRLIYKNTVCRSPEYYLKNI